MLFNKDKIIPPPNLPPDLLPVPLPPPGLNPYRYWLFRIGRYVGTMVILPVSGKVFGWLNVRFRGNQPAGGNPVPENINQGPEPFNLFIWVWNGDQDLSTRILKIIGLSVTALFGYKAVNKFVTYVKEKETNQQDLLFFKEDLKNEIKSLLIKQPSENFSLETVSDNLIGFINFVNPILIFFGVMAVSISFSWKYFKKEHWETKPKFSIDSFGNEIIRVKPGDISEIDLLQTKTDFNALRKTTSNTTVLTAIDNSEKALRTYIDSLKVMKEIVNNGK